MSKTICLACGVSNASDMSFCTNCGKLLRAENQPVPSHEPPSKVFIGLPNAETLSSPAMPAFSPPVIDTSRKSKVYLWAAAVTVVTFLLAGILGIGILGYYGFGRNPSTIDSGGIHIMYKSALYILIVSTICGGLIYFYSENKSSCKLLSPLSLRLHYLLFFFLG